MTVDTVGTEVEVIWNGRRTHAFVPETLANRTLTLDASTAARTATAATEVAHAAEALVADYEPLARLLLRSQGVASSYIEGVSALVVDGVLDAQHHVDDNAEAAAWVSSTHAAVPQAVANAQGNAPLDVATLLEWHRTLMSGR